MTHPIGRIRVDREPIVDLLQELIRLNSVNPILQHDAPGEREIAHFLGGYLHRLGLEVDVEEVSPGRWNCVAVMGGTDCAEGHGDASGGTLILNGHTDVVPADAMKIEPFSPAVRDGRVFGRGAADMKAGLASMVMAAERIVATGLRLKGDLILAFVADEEYSSLGTEHFIGRGDRADGAIVLEPTGEDVLHTHKGYAWIKASVRGRAAHGSRPEDGINAISKASRLIGEVDALSIELGSVRHPVLGASLIHNSLIRGGSDISTVPALCEVDFEQRTLPGQTAEDVASGFHTVIRRIRQEDPDFDASVDVYFTRPPLETPVNEGLISTLTAAYRGRTGRDPALAGAGFWTDAALLSQAGIPSVLFGPIGAGFHEDVESVEIDSLVRVTEVIIDTILDFCGVADSSLSGRR